VGNTGWQEVTSLATTGRVALRIDNYRPHLTQTVFYLAGTHAFSPVTSKVGGSGEPRTSTSSFVPSTREGQEALQRALAADKLDAFRPLSDAPVVSRVEINVDDGGDFAALRVELGGSSRMGLGALLLGLDLASAGRRALVCAGDVVVGAPGGSRESQGGDAAVAFVTGGDGEAIARLIGRASSTIEILDVWRLPEERFGRQWEERFTADTMAPAIADTAKRALASAGVEPSSLSTVILDGTTQAMHRLAKEPPNNAAGAASIGGRGIILCSGAAGNSLGRYKTGLSGLSCAVSGIKTESGRDQTRPCASRVFLTITRLASANRVRSCAVFLAKPR
jgi:hypothetical protein